MILFYFLALVASSALAAPANSSQFQMPVDPTQSTTNISLSPQLTLSSDYSVINSVTATLFVASASPGNSTETTSSQVTQFNDSSSTLPVTPPISFTSFSLSFFSVPATSTSLTSTIFVTEVVTAFQTTTINIVPSPSSIVTVVVTEIATTTTTPATSTVPSLSWENRTHWAAPPQMTDLSAFNVTYFPSGQRNLRIVSQVPSNTIAPTAKFLQSALSPSSNATANTSAILQLVYPAHSVNPGSKPVGGAGFYATPLNLTGARNVTLEYSVFFPADFNWVKGGKLPGLFGGHTGCSGGASARDCFSTRLMWRPQGIGELYLYAPKDKQSDALCADVASVCDAAYGFSIGRGAFRFATGDWTHLAQTVVLNTPGHNNGEFTLYVDGRLAIARTDVLYRDVVPRGANGDGVAPQPAEFLGLFFSTFFGGHGKQYATPRQQYTWFKDFAVMRHD